MDIYASANSKDTEKHKYTRKLEMMHAADLWAHRRAPKNRGKSETAMETQTGAIARRHQAAGAAQTVQAGLSMHSVVLNILHIYPINMLSGIVTCPFGREYFQKY